MLGARKENEESYPPNTLSSLCVPSNLYLILIVAFNEIIMSVSTLTSTCVDFHHKFSMLLPPSYCLHPLPCLPPPPQETGKIN